MGKTWGSLRPAFLRPAFLRPAFLRPALLAPLALVCLGCPNPNTYTTPRTVGSGNFSHTVAAEGWGFAVQSTANGTTSTVSGTLPTLPTYQLRIGVGDNLEIGARIANMTSLGTDVKFNFLRSPLLDIAIDPGAQLFAISSSNSNGSSESIRVLYLHAPLLVGLNLAQSFSLVFSPGVTFPIVSGSVSTGDGEEQAATTSATMGRFGVGFNIRVSQGFALHPEVTFLRTFKADAVTMYMVGLGFNFGTLPRYDDVGGGSAAPPPPPGPPPGAPPPPPGPPAGDAPPPPPG